MYHQAKLNSGKSKQQLLSTCSTGLPQQSEFAKDVLLAFLKEGIPLNKLEKGPLRDVLEKYSGLKVPSVTSLRRMVPQLHEENLSAIRKEIGQSKIWLSIDEATDPLGRNIANVVIGKLDGNEPSNGRLIHVTQLDKTNSSTIVQTVQEALRILWQGAANTSDRLLLLVTDSVAYMLSAGRTLKEIYPKLIHETCLAHGLHRVAEAIREEHPEVNQLISLGKKIFLKAPKRIEVFRRILPEVPLPPQPVVTRWGTWLTAASYYFDNLEGFKKVVEELEDDAECVHSAKVLLKDGKLSKYLIFIQTNFKDIPKTIEQLQSNGTPFSLAVEKMEHISNTRYCGSVGRKITAKVKAVLERNCGWVEVRNIARQLRGEDGANKENWTMDDVVSMKFAPTTSAQVERTFSKLGYILSDRRLQFTIDNIASHLILFFNSDV